MATLDATLSGPTSNSYITLAEATAIAANQPFADDWISTSDDDLLVGLITACMWMETLNYAGERCKATQRLKWPRSGASCDGVVADCSAIPYKIQETQVQLAWVAVKDPSPIIDGGGGGAAAGTYVKRQKLGSLEIEYDQYSGTSVTSCDNCNDPIIITKYPWIRDLLGCWLGGGVSGGVGLMLRVRS